MTDKIIQRTDKTIAVDINLTGGEFLRLANNFYQVNNLHADIPRLNTDAALVNFILQNAASVQQKYRVALVFICLNPEYWEYAKNMIDGSKQFFLPGHVVDWLFWSDMPELDDTKALERAREHLTNLYTSLGRSDVPVVVEEAMRCAVDGIVAARETTVFETGPQEWPMPTLMRYHLFLQQEEKLREYDYIFYCDVDMMFVNVVGDEILSEGLTAAQHPMYALDKTLWPPYEPNPNSAAYIPRPGLVINDNGKPRFMPLYFAGGFQGGKTDTFITAMKAMRKMADSDMAKNYIPIWNDESIWNKYLFENPPSKVLTPSYIYPDSLINEFYVPRWGRNYPPKLVTLTKKHTLKQLSAEEQQQIIAMQKR